MRRWQLSRTQLGRLLGVSRQAVPTWIESGVPANRAPQVADVEAITDLLDRHPKGARIPDRHQWYRICEARWSVPLDPSFAQAHGGRWNPPRSWPIVYLSEDVVTARMNLTRLIADWPYESEDLAEDTGPHLVGATLPRGQQVADLHRPEGVAAAGLRGVRCRSAPSLHGAGREVAWFPATPRSRMSAVTRQPFTAWFWG